MLKKLHIRFVCITMSITTVMLCVLLGMVIHFTGRAMEERSLQTMRGMSALPGPPGRGLEQIRLPHFTVAFDRSGEPIVVEGENSLVDAQKLEEIVRLMQQSQRQHGVLKEHGLRFSKLPGSGPERILFVDITDEQATMTSLVRTCVVIGILGWFLFLGVSVLLAKWAIGPVERAWQQQRQFVADASHELKTPLTVIMTNAEMLQDDSYGLPERQRFAESILTMSKQMRGLVLGLLELTRVDNGAVKESFSAVDMSQLVNEGVLPFEPVFFEKGMPLAIHVEENVQISGSKHHLHQVLDILLDNAMKYAVPPGIVEVRLKRQGIHCVLSVSNAGETLTREELKDVFKRFYRADPVRSRSGSYGLGLSIAEGIVRDHRGKIWAESENGRVTFFVQLPTIG